MSVPASCSVASGQVMKLIPLSSSSAQRVWDQISKRLSKCCAMAAEKRENKEALLVAANERV